MYRNTIRKLAATCAAAALVAIAPLSARAQNPLDNLYPDFFKIQYPGHLSVLGFGGGYVSDKYGTVQEGFQLEQSVTRYIALFGRMTGYELFIGEGFDDPLAPGAGHFARLNFGRGQGGVDFQVYPGTHLYVSGGQDFGDSKAQIVEGDFSSWWLLHSAHPVNFSFSSIHNFQNGITSTEIDFQTILLTTEKYMVLAGGGGAYYTGGFLSSDEGQGGPDLGFYYRPWKLGFSAQAGYGSSHQFGQLSMYKELDFFER